MVESTAAVPEETIKLTQLDIKCKASLEDRQRYQVIFDSTENCEVFFRYKAHLLEINKLHLGVTIGRMTKADAIEQVRKSLVSCMRTGDRLVLYCGKMAIDFLASFDGGPDNLPIETLFNFQEWRKEENYKKIVRPEENHDLLNNKNCYYMNEKFDIIILQENKGDSESKESQKAKIPHLNGSFDIYIVQ